MLLISFSHRGYFMMDWMIKWGWNDCDGEICHNCHAQRRRTVISEKKRLLALPLRWIQRQTEAKGESTKTVFASAWHIQPEETNEKVSDFTKSVTTTALRSNLAVTLSEVTKNSARKVPARVESFLISWKYVSILMFRPSDIFQKTKITLTLLKILTRFF